MVYGRVFFSLCVGVCRCVSVRYACLSVGLHRGLAVGSVWSWSMVPGTTETSLLFVYGSRNKQARPVLGA